MKESSHIHIKLLGLIALVLLAISSCVTEFGTEDFSFERLVVVDAAFTDEDKIQVVKLSYTSPLGFDGLAPLTGANVSVEDDLEEVINFIEQSPGTYSTIHPFQGIEGRSYQLVFVTEEGKRYESIAEPLVKSPPLEISQRFTQMDSDELDGNEQGLLFSIDSGDETGKAQFFRYAWNDAKQTTVPLPARFRDRIITVDRALIVPVQQDVEICYRFGSSTSLLLASTVGLTENLVLDMPIRFNPMDSLNFMSRYSIEVTQYAVSAEAHSYYRRLQRLSETNGSLINKQQGVVRGNVRFSDNENEIVLGYFEVSGASKLRKFFNPDEFNDEFTMAFVDFSRICNSSETSIPVSELSDGSFLISPDFLDRALRVYDFDLTNSNPPFSSGILFQAIAQCTDCRIYGELTQKPAYWID